jgi:hypothetical protein
MTYQYWYDVNTVSHTNCLECNGAGYIQVMYNLQYDWDGAKFCTKFVVCPSCHGSKKYN